MAEVLSNQSASVALAAAITASSVAVTRASAATGWPGDTNGPPLGNFRIVVTDGTNYEIMLVTAGQGTTSPTVTRAVELISGVQTAFAFGTTATMTPVPTAAGLGAVTNGVGQFIVGFDGGGSVLSAPLVQDVVAPFAGTITSWELLSDVLGSAVVDVWAAAFANYPPTSANSITGSAPPTLSSAESAQSSTLTGWITTVAAGDVFRFTLASVSVSERLVVVLNYSR